MGMHVELQCISRRVSFMCALQGHANHFTPSVLHTCSEEHYAHASNHAIHMVLVAVSEVPLSRGADLHVCSCLSFPSSAH